jgi:hypothetical protein
MANQSHTCKFIEFVLSKKKVENSSQKNLFKQEIRGKKYEYALAVDKIGVDSLLKEKKKMLFILLFFFFECFE